MSISSNERVSNAQTSLRNLTTSSSNETNELNKNDFMNLFLTQMSHQTPTDPMDNGAMMTQISQLGSMEQLENLNSEMKSLNETQKEIARFQALQFLEKDVLLETENIALARGAGKPVYFSLEKEADSIQISVEDKDGLPIYTEQLGITAPGKHRFVWEGKNNEGVLMGDGNYQVNFRAKYMDGTTGKLQTFNSGKISQIEYKKGIPWAKTNNGMIPLSQITSIDNSSKQMFGNASPLPYLQTIPPKEMITKNN